MIRVRRTVLTWHRAELWCLPSCTMSRWYRAARLGSMRRAALAEANRDSRRGASPDLVGGPCLPFTPEAFKEGTRPLKERAPARERNRLGSPNRARICAALTFPTPGTETKM